ncbi:MAG: hypothetical protein CMJ94_11335 [Planctomycetes bacterium]|nr:hypothetical protein [Planctomycetota bacterium]
MSIWRPAEAHFALLQVSVIGALASLPISFPPKTVATQYRVIVKLIEGLPSPVVDLFRPLVPMVEEREYGFALACGAALLERAERRALYIAAVKKHKCNAELAHGFIDRRHMTRATVEGYMKAVVGRALPRTVRDQRKVFEAARDKYLHGRNLTDADARSGLAEMVRYAGGLDAHVQKMLNKSPFGSLTGFTGRIKLHDKNTSRWMLKGMFGEIEELNSDEA